MPLNDFKCACGHECEELVKFGDVMPCEVCGSAMTIAWKVPPKQFGTIIPTYPGSKKIKAGYVHTHADRPATKVSSGPSGCMSPKT